MSESTEERAQRLLSELMLLKLQAWNSGQAHLADICHRAERQLRAWLEALQR